MCLPFVMEGVNEVGLMHTGSKEKQIYAAYGMTVYVIRDRYDWTIYDNKPMENVYTKLRIEKDEKDIINVHLGNRCIFEENFNRTIDNFLWWINRDNPDAYDIENAVFKSLTQTDSLFNHLIGNRKRKEKAEADERVRVETIHIEQNRQLEMIKQYCDKKGLVAKQYLDKVCIIKLHNENVRQMIENADSKQFEGLMKFMNEHPDNKDAVIVIYGELEEIANKIA